MTKIKERLLAKLKELPESRCEELLDFAEFLLAKEYQKIGQPPGSEEDPILDYIGGVSHSSLAKNIDKELYGERD